MATGKAEEDPLAGEAWAPLKAWVPLKACPALWDRGG